MLSANSIVRKTYAYLQKKAFKYLKLKHRLSSGYEVQVLNQMEWIIFNDIFVEGDYDEAIRQAFNVDAQTINVLDLGGNVGFFELRIAHLLSALNIRKMVDLKVLEGSSFLCNELKRRTQQVNASIKIQVHHGLAGHRSGQGTLYEFDNHGLNSIFRSAGRATDVPYLDVSKLCEAWVRIHLLKIDIEGSELIFLQEYHDILKKTNAVVVEFHPELCNIPACLNILKDAGFTVQRILKDYGNCSIHLFLKP